MSDDLRAAAETVLRGVAGRYAPRLGYSDLPPETAAAVRLAEAYLAANPADENEPVTEERLRAAGFTAIIEDELWTPQRHADGAVVTWSLVWNSVLSPNWKTKRWEIAFPGCTSYLGHDLETMGEVRRLCKALGVPLTEAHP